jgi:hypothetical protein
MLIAIGGMYPGEITLWMETIREGTDYMSDNKTAEEFVALRELASEDEPFTCMELCMYSTQPVGELQEMARHIVMRLAPVCSTLGFQYVRFTVVSVAAEKVESNENYPAFYIEMAKESEYLIHPDGNEFVPKLTKEQEVAERMGINPMTDYKFELKDLMEVCNDQIAWYRKAHLKKKMAEAGPEHNKNKHHEQFTKAPRKGKPS